MKKGVAERRSKTDHEVIDILSPFGRFATPFSLLFVLLLMGPASISSLDYFFIISDDAGPILREEIKEERRERNDGEESQRLDPIQVTL